MRVFRFGPGGRVWGNKDNTNHCQRHSDSHDATASATDLCGWWAVPFSLICLRGARMHISPILVLPMGKKKGSLVLDRVDGQVCRVGGDFFFLLSLRKPMMHCSWN